MLKLQSGLLEASGKLSGRQGRSEADFGQLLGALGALMAADVPVLGLLGPLSRGAPGGHSGLGRFLLEHVGSLLAGVFEEYENPDF